MEDSYKYYAPDGRLAKDIPTQIFESAGLRAGEFPTYREMEMYYKHISMPAQNTVEDMLLRLRAMIEYINGAEDD